MNALASGRYYSKQQRQNKPTNQQKQNKCFKKHKLYNRHLTLRPRAPQQNESAEVPFPFPYSQYLSLMLIAHWIMTPVVASHLVVRPWWVPSAERKNLVGHRLERRELFFTALFFDVCLKMQLHVLLQNVFPVWSGLKRQQVPDGWMFRFFFKCIDRGGVDRIVSP